MASGWPAVRRHTWSRSASPSSRSAGSEVVSSAAPERVSGPSWRKASRPGSCSPRVNGWRQVISSFPVQLASRAASAGSRTVHRPDSSDRLSSKLSQDDEVRFGRPGGEAGRRHLAVDGVDHAPGLEPADPRGDLGRERRFADAAHPVHDEPAAARSGEVGGPPAAFGRSDGQGVTAAGPQVRGSRVPGGVPDPDRPSGGWLGGPARGVAVFRVIHVADLARLAGRGDLMRLHVAPECGVIVPNRD